MSDNLVLGKISLTTLIKLKEEIAFLENKKQLSNAEKAGLIKFFELSYEQSWKILKKILLLHRSLDIKSGTKDIFREAAKAGYIDDPSLWFNFIEERNETVHAYNEEKVDEIISDLVNYRSQLDKLINNLLSL